MQCASATITTTEQNRVGHFTPPNSLVTYQKWRNGDGVKANMTICQQANVLLAAAVHFNYTLTLCVWPLHDKMSLPSQFCVLKKKLG